MRDRPRLTAALTAAFAILYGASPIDVIPDVFIPWGFGDDAVVLVAAGYAIFRVLRRRAMGPSPASGKDEIIVERID